MLLGYFMARKPPVLNHRCWTRRGPETLKPSPVIEMVNDFLSITSVDTEQTLRPPTSGY